MFDTPLEHQYGDSLTGDLVALYDEFTEFNDYCSFLYDAFACIVAQEEILDDETVKGIGRSSNWMKHRVREMKARFKDIQQRSVEEKQSD